ncbi:MULTISPECIES: glutaminase [Streptomyces]|uniref:Glutaminase n=1 Tax=Streptomyces griseus TaxID=1911 RepID=A0A380PAK6_STRGR|nr:glutaminase [Streptomyces griseus]SUP62220.1 Glutaminase [Streptomyces griseus]
MRSPIPEYLDEVLRNCADDRAGAVADYVPELAAADPEQLAVAVSAVDGTVYEAGDSRSAFTIQSISKPFVYALALADRGCEAVLARIGVEPSGEAFNELSLEEGSARPRNPMINVGALTAHTLAGPPGAPREERFERIVAGISAFAGRRLEVDEAVCRSEWGTAHRNLAIAHMLRGYEVIEEDAPRVVADYIRQCSLLVTTRDLALMAATLANGGVQPVTGEQVVSREVVRQVLSVMTTCGMYDAAGDWVTTVGIPAKSGVSGGILGALPGQVGIGVLSPRLDRHGNSVRGVRVCERLSADMGLHLMEASAPARSALRGGRVLHGPGSRSALVHELQGTLQFAGAERLVHGIAHTPPGHDEIGLDLTRVHSVNSVARRMILETVRRLTLDGHAVTLIDPEGVLPDPDAGDGVRPRVVDTWEWGAAPGPGS